MGNFIGYFFDTKAGEYWHVTAHNGLYYVRSMDSDDSCKFDSLPASWVKVFWDINGDVRRSA